MRGSTYVMKSESHSLFLLPSPFLLLPSSFSPFSPFSLPPSPSQEIERTGCTEWRENRKPKHGISSFGVSLSRNLLRFCTGACCLPEIRKLRKIDGITFRYRLNIIFISE